MDKIRVAAVDDAPLIRQAIETLIDPIAEMELVAMGKVGADVMPLVEEYEPDVLLLDLSMPQNEELIDKTRFNALLAIDQVLEKYPKTRIVVLSSHRIQTLIHKARNKGIPGYLLKSDDLSIHLPEAITTVYKGGIYFSETIGQQVFRTENEQIELSPRQVAVLNAIYSAPDASYAELANALEIKEATLKYHLKRTFDLLGVTNKTAAVLKSLDLGFIHNNIGL